MLEVAYAAELVTQGTPLWATILIGVIAAVGIALGPALGARAAIKSAGLQARSASQQLDHEKIVDVRSHWWAQTQHAIGLCGSDNPRIRAMGLAMMEELARSPDPSPTERRMLSAAASAFITEPTRQRAQKAAARQHSVRAEGVQP